MNPVLVPEVEGFEDLDLHIEVQVDHRMMTLRQILEIESEHVIKLSRSAGENMDILIAGSNIGHGEIVVIDDTVGIRITDFGEED